MVFPYGLCRRAQSVLYVLSIFFPHKSACIQFIFVKLLSLTETLYALLSPITISKAVSKWYNIAIG